MARLANTLSVVHPATRRRQKHDVSRNLRWYTGLSCPICGLIGRRGLQLDRGFTLTRPVAVVNPSEKASTRPFVIMVPRNPMRAGRCVFLLERGDEGWYA